MVGIVAVAVTTIAVTPTMAWGTILWWWLLIIAQLILDWLGSSGFAESHEALWWIVTGLLSAVLYAIPALAIYLGLRRRNPGLCRSLLYGWLMIYLAFLTFLFDPSEVP